MFSAIQNTRSYMFLCCMALLFLVGCESVPEGPGVLGITPEMTEEEDFMAQLDPSQLLAYVLEDEPSIYVAKGMEQKVAQQLKAKVDGEIWTLKEDTTKRQLRELRWEEWYPRVAIIKWTYLDGFKCEEKPAGTWINITDKRNRFLRSFQTTEDDWWCTRQRGQQCKLVMKTITGDFYTRPQGGGNQLQETRQLSACLP